MNTIFYFFPFIGAFTGWMLHSVIIHKFIPASKKIIAKNAGKWVGQNIVAGFKLDEKFRDPSQFEKIRPFIESHVDEFLRVKLGQQMPMISMFVGDKTIDKMKTVFMDELQVIFPGVIGKLTGSLENEIDVGKMLSEKLASIDDRKWKNLVEANLGDHLKKLRLLGALTGFIIGALMLLILVLV
jgi:uncharacterized membrane-anchored protein YjiN (DUF445 family)